MLDQFRSIALPEGEEALYKLALRMGYGQGPGGRGDRRRPRDEGDGQAGGGPPSQLPPLSAFLRDYREKTDLNRNVWILGDDGKEFETT